MRTGKYVHGWGWDPDLYEERAFGDESWVEKMDDLFDRGGGSPAQDQSGFQ